VDLYFGNINSAGQIILEDDEFRHLKVVRKNVGEKIMITDGAGNIYTSIISEINKHDCVATIESTEIQKISRPLLHLAIAPTKNIDRIEWLLEKCVELGLYKISFIACRHSERKDVKTERLKRIAISAIKQSGKALLPVINEMQPFNNFLKTELEEQRLICAMEAGVENHLKHILKPGKDAVILIGPEGDFHESEIQSAKENGFVLTSLGHERLRTETAALGACVYFNFNRHGW
jgi:16S rRNA (uracil1498-N3)-methyltransferase